FDLVGREGIRQRASTADDVADASSIGLVFHFSRPLEKHLNISDESFPLFGTPAVYLLRHDAIRIRADHKRTEYRVLPGGEDPSHYEICSIDHVQGWGHQQRHNQVFKRFESFDHFESVPVANHIRYYRERKKPSVAGYGMES